MQHARSCIVAKNPRSLDLLAGTREGRLLHHNTDDFCNKYLPLQPSRLHNFPRVHAVGNGEGVMRGGGGGGLAARAGRASYRRIMYADEVTGIPNVAGIC